MKCPACGVDVRAGETVCSGCGADLAAVLSEWAHETTTMSGPRVQRAEGAVTSVGKYRVIRGLGKGAMGCVYLGRDEVLGRDVAIKTMIAGEDASEDAIARFMSEAKAAGKLQHPSIVSVHEVGRSRALHYMVMDYVDGITLKDLLRQGPPSARRTAEIIRDTARALDYAHAQGVIHRDVKPANIMIAKDGSVRLMDFGLARNLDAEHSLTRSGDIMGTPAYINPEQALGRAKDVDARSDVYSLGAVMYEMLTGATPAHGTNVMEIITQVTEADPVRPSKLKPGVNRDLEVICLKALFKEPARRYQTGGALADDLQRFLDNEPIAARPASVFYKAGKWGRKNRTALTAVTVVLAAAVLVLGLVWQRHSATARELALKVQDEKREWILMYEQTFDAIAVLGDEWEAGLAGTVRESALYIDGTVGGTVVWLNVPIIGEEWRFEYDGWPAADALQLNDIGLFVKADRHGTEWRSGFEVQFGGRTNKCSGIIYNGKDIYVVERPDTIRHGHRYHFVITYRDGLLGYRAVDTTTREVIIDKTAAVPDINVARENQRQGFWTWGSRIFIDNVRISKLGLPERRTYEDVAMDLMEVIGATAAVEYLCKEMERRPDTERVQCCRLIVKCALNGSIEERRDLAPRVIGVFAQAFPGATPSAILGNEFIHGFYELFAEASEREGGADPALAAQLEADPVYREYLKNLEARRLQQTLNEMRRLAEQGDREQALAGLDELYARTRTASPQTAAEALRAMALIRQERQEFDEAIRIYEQIIADFPKTETIRTLMPLAHVFMAAGDSAGAEQTMLRIISDYPEYRDAGARAMAGIANLRRQHGDIAEALDVYRNVVTNYPDQYQACAGALDTMARIACSRGDYGHAREHWQRIADEYIEAEMLWSVAMFMTGRFTVAELEARLGPTRAGMARFYEGEQALISRDNAAAAACYTRCLQEPRLGDAYIQEAAARLKALGAPVPERAAQEYHTE